jgi:hypothetical protein
MISLYNALRSGGLFDDRKPYFDNTRPTKVTAQVRINLNTNLFQNKGNKSYNSGQT